MSAGAPVTGDKTRRWRSGLVFEILARKGGKLGNLHQAAKICQWKQRRGRHNPRNRHIRSDPSPVFFDLSTIRGAPVNPDAGEEGDEPDALLLLKGEPA
jgi:hypothetical protein